MKYSNAKKWFVIFSLEKQADVSYSALYSITAYPPIFSLVT
jgi:hypothetical protein